MVKLPTLSDSTLTLFAKEVYRHTGITMDATKRSMLAGRIRRRMRALDLPTFEAYLDHLRSNRREVDPFIDAVTTNKTSFFRTTSVWDFLANEWLPERSGTTRAWSAAASKGQEAASLALILDANQQKTGGRWSVHGSDVSPEMVDIASTQTFDNSEVDRAVSAAPCTVNRGRVFTDNGNGTSTLAAGLRRNQTFRRHNLLERHSGGPYDLILVRNVIIYFSATDKVKVMKHALSVLRPGGLLVIGESESMVEGLGSVELLRHCVLRKNA